MRDKFNPTGWLASVGCKATILLCAGMPHLSGAVTATVSVTVLEAPSCVINGNRTIEVDFGDVLTVDVDGKKHLKDLVYELNCTDPKRNAMQMQIQGAAAAFDASALQTNISDFGIALRANGQPLNVNSWLKFTYPDKPKLQAVPVKNAGKKLSGGTFSVGATLLVVYQ